MPPSVQQRFMDFDINDAIRELSRDLKEELQELVFERMPYSEKLQYCLRPEDMGGPSSDAWTEINAYLGTNAKCIQELVEELGIRRFGHRPRVGDSFCGGGSVPFEAARIGCDAYASDLNPVAMLLTWASLKIVGGGIDVSNRIQEAQRRIFNEVNRQILEWGIENNSRGWRSDAFLHCVEVKCPECGWKIPLLPDFVIVASKQIVAELSPNPIDKSFHIEIHEDVDQSRLEKAKQTRTIKESRLICPHCSENTSTPIDLIRRDLRMWENDDVKPRPNDIFQERLYCIRWVETYYEQKKGSKVRVLSKQEAEGLSNFGELIETGVLKEKRRRHYMAPDQEDLDRERNVHNLLKERFFEWQEKGYIPVKKIEPGLKTDEPIRTRGWTYWHHLFTPRQLLMHGLLMQSTFSNYNSEEIIASALLGAGKCSDWNSKLCRWGVGAARESFAQTFYNQALNTLYTYGSKGLHLLGGVWYLRFDVINLGNNILLSQKDARDIDAMNDIWITDPPYADAINYHELSEFFTAWYEKNIKKYFSDWYSDSKRSLAIKANNPVEFRKSMMECYARLVKNMPENGMQVVMFTHQDAAVWADLTMILWAAGLRVTAAWCIATETDSATKDGNYVQGTVLLVCRKRMSQEKVFIDEIAHKVENEVRKQLDTMIALDDKSNPNFGDSDYQLAAYAAALRVLTERPIEEIDPGREILRVRPKGEKNPVEELIRNAVKIACDHLVPKGIHREIWKLFSAIERFYLKGLEVEANGEKRIGALQELARGFGADEYHDLLESAQANQARLKTASEFGKRALSGQGFGGTLTRQILFAVHQVVRNDDVQPGLNYLHTELSDYWNQRNKIIELLGFFASLGRIAGAVHWKKDSESSALLAGAVMHDHI